jgi:peptidoglycan/LPS O-acetylase OafA/YrhL
MEIGMSTRVEELDSLRGLAALSVVFHHHLMVLPALCDGQGDAANGWFVYALKYTPLHFVWAGHQAVLFFFILSGFVLYLPCVMGNSAGYARYLVKRSCRIYLPYLAAVAVTVCLMLLARGGELAGLSTWANAPWHAPITMGTLVNHVLFIGSFPNNELNPVIWSLIHEMRISLIFPLIAWLVTRLPARLTVAIALGISAAGLLIHHFSRLIAHTDYALTVHFASFFVLGAILARNRMALVLHWRRLPSPVQVILALTGVYLYTAIWLVPPALKPRGYDTLAEYFTGMGIAVILIASLGSLRLSRFLRDRQIACLGRVSYSLYLYHAVALLTLLHFLCGKVPLAVILLCSIFCGVALAILAYYVVEEPSMALGRRLTLLLQARQPPLRETGARENFSREERQPRFVDGVM